jgi:hypothetical protein
MGPRRSIGGSTTSRSTVTIDVGGEEVHQQHQEGVNLQAKARRTGSRRQSTGDETVMTSTTVMTGGGGGSGVDGDSGGGSGSQAKPRRSGGILFQRRSVTSPKAVVSGGENAQQQQKHEQKQKQKQEQEHDLFAAMAVASAAEAEAAAAGQPVPVKKLQRPSWGMGGAGGGMFAKRPSSRYQPDTSLARIPTEDTSLSSSISPPRPSLAATPGPQVGHRGPRIPFEVEEPNSRPPDLPVVYNIPPTQDPPPQAPQPQQPQPQSTGTRIQRASRRFTRRMPPSDKPAPGGKHDKPLGTEIT